jgi:hypothetical protein
VFYCPSAAATHFGATPFSSPICQVDVVKFRQMEEELQRYRSEDTELHRKIETLQSENAAAVRTAEESGYEKGLRDGRGLKT